MSRGRVLVTLIVLLVSTGRTAAQDRLADAKALYDNAAYEEALKLLDQAANVNPAPEVHQYRALCLIALGRAEAAEKAITVVLAADPFFVPDAREVAPRVVTMFTDTRRRLLPQMIRRTFTEARTLFRDGDREKASERFDQVLRLLSDASLSEDQDLADLRLVADGFKELVRAQPAPAPPAAAAPNNAPRPTAATAALPVTPAVAESAPPAIDTRSAVVTPPVAITQALPQWRPPDAATARRSYSGAVRVVIDAEGRVTSAAMERSVYPPYDRVVLNAAREWLYKPATRDGRPIGSETTVEIRLGPAQRN